jgi:hypothetical protein
MKQLFLALILLGGLSVTLSAQHASQNGKSGDQKTEMKDGVMMKNDTMMLCKNNTCTPLKKSYTCSDGCKVAIDGTVTKPDGMTMKLQNGQGLDENGQMTLVEEASAVSHTCTSACTATNHAYKHGEKGHTCTEACKKKM